MTTTSSVGSSSSTPPSSNLAPATVNVGNAQDVSGLVASSVSLSLADEVTSKVQPSLDRATAIQTQINTNQTQIAAYQNMQSLLQALQNAAANLTSESTAGSNVFLNRAATLSSNSATAASSIMSASVAPGTSTGSHTVTVNSLAQAEADTSATLALTSTDPISNLTGFSGNGTITIAESGKTSPVPVNITGNMTLSDVASAINGATATNGVTASVVTVDSGHQVLVLTAANTNQTLSFNDTNNVLQALGFQSSTLTSKTFPDETSALGLSGAFTINGAGDAPVAVNVTAADSLDTIVGKIQAASSQITATVVNGNQLEIVDAVNGSSLSFSGVSGNALSGLGFNASGVLNQATAAQALNLTVDGVTGITRNSNTVSDVLSGVTMNFTQASPSTQVTVQITPDAQGTAQAVNSFVTAYNNWENFVQQNEATDSSGNAASGAVLFGNSSLRDASLQVDQAITAEVGGTSLGALGISLDNNNQMQIDPTTLDDSLNNNFDTVAGLFQSSLTTSTPDLQPSGNNLSSFAGAFTLGITAAGGNITGLTVNGQNASNDFIFAGNTIQGLFGSKFAGMFFTYTGTGGNVTVTSTQGVGNQVFTAANNFANSTTGSIQGLITDDENQNLQFTSQYNNLINQANDLTNFLLTQYSALTQQIQAAGQTQQTLQALMNAQFSNNG